MRYVVTGANRGLGLEFTRQLTERGDTVVATARWPEEADKLNEYARQDERDIEVHELDVTAPDIVESFADTMKEREIDILINNAGRLHRGGSPEDFEFEEIRGDFETNAIGTLRVVEALLPNLKRGGGAKLVNVTSKMGSIADNESGGSYAYRMSKTALNMATRSLAIDLAADDVTAFVIHPGWVQTRMGGEEALITPETSVENMLQRIDEADDDQAGQFLEWDGGQVPW
jgi:NAD(P)-dependent dehydrogenase (short-subunit alcohol dehydrogenase family)